MILRFCDIEFFQNKHYALFRLLAYSGLQKGELYALKWEDFDSENQLLTVSKNLGRIDGHAIEKGTKNTFSIRSIYLDDKTCSILNKWKQETSREKWQLSVQPLSLDKEFMFTYCNRDGEIEPLHADYINNILKHIIRKYNLKKISPHGFRHTHATLMIELYIDPVNTAKRLGHASRQMTLDTYGHATKTGENSQLPSLQNILIRQDRQDLLPNFRFTLKPSLERLPKGLPKYFFHQKKHLANSCKVF